MTKLALIIGAAIATLALVSSAAAAAVLAKDSTSGSFASVIYSTDLKWDDDFNTIPQPYSSLVLKINAPRSQVVKTKWSISARRGDFSREISGTIVRRGSYSKVIRPPMASADYIIVSTSASRDWEARGRLSITLLGRRAPA
jgi:hypothetical protein